MRAEVTRCRLEIPGHSGTAFGAAAIFVQTPAAELVPVAFDQQFPAAMTPCAGTAGVVHVAGVGVVHPIV